MPMEEGSGEEEKEEDDGLDNMCASVPDAGPHIRTTASQDLGKRPHAATRHPVGVYRFRQRIAPPDQGRSSGALFSMGLGTLRAPTSRESGMGNSPGKVKDVRGLGGVTWVAFAFFAFRASGVHGPHGWTAPPSHTGVNLRKRRLRGSTSVGVRAWLWPGLRLEGTATSTRGKGSGPLRARHTDFHLNRSR